MTMNTSSFNTIVAEAMDELNGVWEREEALEREYESFRDSYDGYTYVDLAEEERKANLTYEGEYTISIHGNEVARVHAMGIDDAEYQAYVRFGTDFIGGSVVCNEQNCWACTACFDSWKWDDENVTREEVAEYCKAQAYARANFYKVASYGYDEDYEPCIHIELCEEGKEYVLRNGGRLAQKYAETKPW